MIDYLFEIGPVTKAGALSATEIHYWKLGTGIELTGWEFTAIKHLSRVLQGAIDGYKGTDSASPIAEAKHVSAEAMKNRLAIMFNSSK